MMNSSPIKLMGTPTHAEESVERLSIEECFLREETPLLRYAYSLVRRREVAEELVQDAFLKAHQHWEGIDQPRAWLYRAVRNLALNHLRKHQRESLQGEQELASHAEHPTRQAAQLEVAAQLRALVADLPEADQALVRLKYEENLSYASIGEKLGLGAGNVGYRLHHVLKALGDGLKRIGVSSSEG